MEPREQSIDDVKKIQQTIMTETAKSRTDNIDASLSANVLAFIMQSKEMEASS